MLRWFRFIKSPKDFLAGVVFVVIAAAFASQVRNLPIGNAFRMGPGYFPMVLAGLLAALGLAVIVRGLLTTGEPLAPVAWRGLLFVVLPVVFFGFTLRGLGLVPALAITVFATTFASVRGDLRTALINTAVLTAGAWFLFIKALSLPISAFGPWVGGY
jgi:putative tricarboxylic transport membrane protein